MKDLQIFKNEEFGEIRTLEINNEPYFVGKDICTMFGDTNYRRSLSNIDDEDKMLIPIETAGGKQNMTVLSENGLYDLLFGMQPKKAKGVSQNEQAINERINKLRKFKRWVTHEVLPSIRKTGGYIAGEENMNEDELVLKAMTVLNKKVENLRLQNEKLENRLEEQKPKVLFADSVETSKTSVLIGELAKIIKQNGHDIGQNRLFQWLRNNNYLISRRGMDYNMPTQKSMNLELFEVKETTITHSDGHISISKTPKVTGKGQVYFVNKFINQ